MTDEVIYQLDKILQEMIASNSSGGIVQIITLHPTIKEQIFCEEWEIEEKECFCGGKLSIEQIDESTHSKLKLYGINCPKCEMIFYGMEHDQATSEELRNRITNQQKEKL